MRKIVKWRQASPFAKEMKNVHKKEILMFLTNYDNERGFMPPKNCTLPSIGLDIDVTAHPFWGACILCWLHQNSWNLKIWLSKSWKSMVCSSIKFLNFPDYRKRKCSIDSILFFDGTVVDKTGRYWFEPFMFILGIDIENKA